MMTQPKHTPTPDEVARMKELIFRENVAASAGRKKPKHGPKTATVVSGGQLKREKGVA